MELNEVLAKVPKHLMNLVIDQPYNSYSAEDHAVWRYVMRQNIRYLPGVAHSSYMEGLKLTGVSIDEIPHMYGMNRILQKIGWAAVAVDGFIPPSAFMEFQAHNVLVIAADIRPIDQIEYTPAPDIIHEAAGHAPIIADPEYAAYLRYFGFLGSKAFSSAMDYSLYEAIRHLSILKADPYSRPEDITKAVLHLEMTEKMMGEPSEMSKIRNLHWWTVEYGLTGSLENPKIYGAGLLSSIGESFSAMKKEVKKIPYTIEAANVAFDITTRQPQLFVTPDFKTLTHVLDEFASGMAYRKGGLFGLNKALESGYIATAEYDTGLQVSGKITRIYEKEGIPSYYAITGPAQLSWQGKQLEGHGKDYHSKGFGAPVGKIEYLQQGNTPFTDQVDDFAFQPGELVIIKYRSGLVVKGKYKGQVKKQDRILLLTFYDCIVEYDGQVLFYPDWGLYDMAVGEKIVSTWPGPADAEAFELTYKVPDEKTHKIEHTERARHIHAYYEILRNQRKQDNVKADELLKIWHEIESHYPVEWLLPLEILEIVYKHYPNSSICTTITEYLVKKSVSKPVISNLINNGLEAMKKLDLNGTY